MLTITPGTAHGSRIRLRSQRRSGNTRFEQHRGREPEHERGHDGAEV